MSHPKKHRVIYVIDQEGNFYVSQPKTVGQFHHSSLLAGGDVLGAGEIFFQEGKFVEINNHSGHYKPKTEHLKYAIHLLTEKGAPMKSVRAVDIREEIRQDKKRKKREEPIEISLTVPTIHVPNPVFPMQTPRVVTAFERNLPQIIVTQ